MRPQTLSDNWQPIQLYRSLIESDLILPAQYHGQRSIRAPGEIKLIQAVLREAIETSQGKRLSENGYTPKQMRESRGARLMREAQEWIESDDDSWLFSFCQCCHHLGIDPKWLRRKLAEGTQETGRAQNAWIVEGR